MKKHFYQLFVLALCLLSSVALRAADVTIDCKAGYSISTVTNGSVQLTNRTFTAGQWTGICLPFDASDAVLTAALGADYNLQQFSSYDETTNTISFKKVTEAKAGTPYFIKVKTTAENPTFTGVTIASYVSDSWLEVTVTTDLIFRGFYFHKDDYQLYDSNNINTYYCINSDGSMGTNWASDGRPGCNAYIIRKNYASYTNKTPTLKFEGSSSTEGGDTGGGEEGGDTGGGEEGGDTEGTASISLTWDVSTQASTWELQNTYKNQRVNITFKNWPFKAQTYNVVSLPFQVTKAKLDQVLGEGTYEVQNYNSYSSTDGYIFKKETGSFTIAAGTPFLLKTDNTITDPTFNNILLTGVTSSDELKITCDDTHFIQAVIFSANKSDAKYDGNSAKNWRLAESGLLEIILYADGTLALSGYFGATDYVSDMKISIEGYEIDPSTLDLTNSSNLAYAISKQVQLTNLPTIYINVPDITSKDEINTKLYKDRSTNVAPYLNATITVKDKSGTIEAEETDAQYLQIKVRGNSTAGASKRPYRLKFAKKHKHDLLGRGYTKRNWTLLANAYDDSKIRNAVTYKLGQMVGMPFNPGYQFVDLVINGDYRGIYQVSDHCEVGANRIDVNEDTGWFVESARADMAEDPKISAMASGISIKNPEFDTEAQTDSLKTVMQTYFNTISGLFANYTDTGWRAYADEESLVKFYSAISYTGDYDGFMTVKMYREADGKLFFGPVWDKDLAYGNYSADTGEELTHTMQNGSYWAGTVINNGGVWGDARFIKKVYNKMKSLSDANLGTILANYADSLSNLIAKSYTLDSLRWHTSNYKIDTMDGTLKEDNRVKALENLKNYVLKRPTWLLNAVKTQYDALGCASLPDDPEPEPTEHSQLTNLPTIYISGTVGDSWSRCGVEIYDKDCKIGGTKTYDATDTKAGVQFQVQGSNSGGKDSFRFKFDKKTQLLSSGSYKQWVLASNDDDPTMARNALAWEMSKAIGLEFTPVYQFVDLYVNDTYMGTYQLCDRVKVESGRALVKGGNKDNDWLVQLADNGEVEEESDTYIAATSTVPNIIPKNPDKDDLTADAYATLISEMTNWFQNTLFKDIDSFSENVNQTQFIKWYIAQELLCTYKGLSSIDLYRSVTDAATDQKAHFGPIWDSEKSFGNNDPANTKHAIDMTDLNTAGSYDGLITEYADYKVMRRVLKNLWLQDWFADGVLAKWQTLYGDSKTTDLLTLMKTAITTIKSEIDASAAKNYSTAGSSGTGWSLKYGTAYETAYSNLTSWLDTRFAYLDAKFKALAADKTLAYNTSKTDASDAWALYHGKTVGKLQLKKRGTIHGSEWNMLTLPFNLDANGIQTVFGQGTTVKEFTRIEETSSSVGLYFTAANSMEAGKPYIVKPTADVAESQLVFSNVTLNLSAPQPVSQGSYTLNGTLCKTTLTPTSSDDKTIKYLGSGANKNTLLYLTQEASINGCRAYFKVADNESAAKPLTFIDSETTAILNVVGVDQTEVQSVYNLQGQQLGTSLEALPRGIYIVNGKKLTK